MKYLLPEIEYSKHYMVYAGIRKRYATSTAICFINETTILVAGYLQKKIYLVDISNNKFDILDEISTNLHPDLMDYKDGLILIACRYRKQDYGTIVLCTIKNNKINFEKEIEKSEFGQIHGCRIIDDQNFIVTVTCKKDRGCYFINKNGFIEKKFDDFELYPKDIFILGNNLFITSSESRPSINQKVKITDSKLYVFELHSLKKIDEIDYYGQSDSISILNDNGFITLQGQDSLLHFKFKNNKLEILKEIKKFNFPHGVGMFSNLIGITNYGDNSVDIYTIDELIT